jgi:ABC-type nickel/cobalt efflux system permease component RcnA
MNHCNSQYAVLFDLVLLLLCKVKMFSVVFISKAREPKVCVSQTKTNKTHTHTHTHTHIHARKHTKEQVQESGKSIAFMLHYVLCPCITYKTIVLYISLFACFSRREEANIILSSL